MDTIQLIGTSTQELLGYLKVMAKVAVSEIKEENVENTYKVEIHGDNLGVLIGYHGETLNHLQHILSLAINNKLEDKIRLVIDVDGWRDERKQVLVGIAKTAFSKARTTGEPQTLPPLSAYERRIIHALASEETDILTHSEGEGAGRKVIIEVKKDPDLI